MLGGSPWWILGLMGRPFAFTRGSVVLVPSVLCTFRGLRAAELVNSEVQADGLLIIDARPFTALGILYLMKFDRFLSQNGESYTVQQSRISYDGTTATLHKALVRGGTV